MPGLEVRLAGLTFNAGPDGDGDDLIVSDLSGWDGPDVAPVTVEKPLNDGAVFVYSRLTSWTLILSGWVVAGPEGIGPARRKLAAALYGLVHTPGNLEVDEEDDTYAVAVYLAGQVRTRQQGPDAISFEATLLATTPTKSVVVGS